MHILLIRICRELQQHQQENQQHQMKIAELKNNLWESQQKSLQMQDELQQLQQLSI